MICFKNCIWRKSKAGEDCEILINPPTCEHFKSTENDSIPPVKPACDFRLTLKQLRIIERELRIIDPTANRYDLTEKQKEKLFDEYGRLVNKILEEIIKRENRNPA